MQMFPREDAPVRSPCVNVCVLDTRTGLCHGCARTVEEITQWPSLNGPERRAVLETVALRKAKKAR